MSSLLTVVLLVIAIFLALSGLRRKKELEELKKELSEVRSSFALLKESSAKLETAKAEFEKTAKELSEANAKQEKRIEELKTALNANSFDGRFPICSNCKDIRDEKGCWHTIEEFIASLSEADFSHSLCPDCAKKLYPDMFEDGKKLHTLTWK